MAQEKQLYNGGSTSVLFTDRRNFYNDPNMVKELWTDETPLLTLAANYNTVTNLADPKFKLFEHRNPWVDQRFQIKEGETSVLTKGNTSITIDMPTASTSNFIGLGSAPSRMLIGLECTVHANSSGKPSGQRKAIVLITGVATDLSSITIKCIYTAGGSYTLTGSEWFVIVGNAHGEGSSSPEAFNDELQVVWGECQMFRTPLKLNKTLITAALRGERKELIRLRKLASQIHKIQKERAFWFGGSYSGSNLDQSDTFGETVITDADGELVRTTMGVLEAMLRYGLTSGDNQTIFDITESTYTYADFVDQTEKVFQYFPENGVKTMLASAKMMSYWSKLEGSGGAGIAGKSKWTIKMSDMKRDTIGFNYRLLETPHGVIQLVPTPALTRSPYNGYGVIVDRNNLTHYIYEPSEYRQNIITDNAPQYQKDEFFSYEGLGMTLREAHKVFRLV